MNLLGHSIGVCSWSLRADGIDQMIAAARKHGLSLVHLGVADWCTLPEADQDRAVERLQPIGITATMIHFAGEDYTSIGSIRRTSGFADETTWPDRERLVRAAAGFTAKLGATKLTAHAGFLPSPGHSDYETIVARVRSLAASAGEFGVDLLLESGQSSPSDLLQFLNDVHAKNVGVNFDPANLLLYGTGEPIDAIPILGRCIRHVHLKDARRSSSPGRKWGTEVPLGEGDVPIAELIEAFDGVGYAGPLVIECEHGAEDVAFALETLRALDRA